MYWPDDGSWYVIEIQTVNVIARTAKIIYGSGETESDLGLDDIARDGHVYLIF